MKQKTKILLLHGALGSKKQFTTLRSLLENKYEVHDLDFDGHGGKKIESDFSINLFSNNVIEYLDINSIHEINIFGYSLGGYVALKTLQSIPDKIKKIVTLGTKFNWDKDSTEKEVKMLNAQKIEEKVPHFAAKLKTEHYPENWKLVVEQTSKLMTGISLHEKLSHEDFLNINHNVVLGIGDLDKMVSKKETLNVLNALINGKMIELENVKHPIDLIDPIVLSAFIKNNIY